MNPIKGPAIKVQLDRAREFVFSWAAIDYLTDRYESVGEAILLVEGIRNPMTMTKKSKQAVMDVFCALLLALTIKLLSLLIRIYIFIFFSYNPQLFFNYFFY